jgi:hypothetical protein
MDETQSYMRQGFLIQCGNIVRECLGIRYSYNAEVREYLGIQLYIILRPIRPNLPNLPFFLNSVHFTGLKSINGK